MIKQQTFELFDLNEKIMQALHEAGFTTPSPIQIDVIPKILNGKDLVGQAQTGTGKTLAFGLPALHLIAQRPDSHVLILTPTRELAKQVSDEIFKFGKYLEIRTAIICGGKSSRMQIDAIRRGVQVVVATPGRLLDLLQSNSLPDFQPSIVVLDEADEMLDMGFLDDIKLIFQFLPKERQTLLFSATMPNPIQQLAKEILNQPLFISVTPNETTNQDIEQFYYMVREEERDQAIVRLIDVENPLKAVIFCRTKKDVDRLTQVLTASGHQVKGLHGDMEQNQREEVIRNFRSHIRILVATDVAARGLNVSEISHVFNYHLPFDSSGYVHRIGRTGRAGNKGVACTLVTSREWRSFQRYEKILSTKISKANIPTLQEVKKIKYRQLANMVLNQALHENVEHVLQLMIDVDVKTITTKLLSYLLSQQVIGGPEQIGVGVQQQDDYHGRGGNSRGKDNRFGSRGPRRGNSRTGSRDGFKDRPREANRNNDSRVSGSKFGESRSSKGSNGSRDSSSRPKTPKSFAPRVTEKKSA
jgi:ATP-dependent RNA helicase DeaD